MKDLFCWTFYKDNPFRFLSLGWTFWTLFSNRFLLNELLLYNSIIVNRFLGEIILTVCIHFFHLAEKKRIFFFNCCDHSYLLVFVFKSDYLVHCYPKIKRLEFVLADVSPLRKVKYLLFKERTFDLMSEKLQRVATGKSIDKILSYLMEFGPVSSLS